MCAAAATAAAEAEVVVVVVGGSIREELIGKLDVLLMVLMLMAETEFLFEFDWIDEEEEEFDEADADDADDVVDDEHEFETINMGVNTFKLLFNVDAVDDVAATDVSVAFELFDSLDIVCCFWLFCLSLFLYFYLYRYYYYLFNFKTKKNYISLYCSIFVFFFLFTFIYIVSLLFTFYLIDWFSLSFFCCRWKI